jgi:hypothetical protein
MLCGHVFSMHVTRKKCRLSALFSPLLQMADQKFQQCSRRKPISLEIFRGFRFQLYSPKPREYLMPRLIIDTLKVVIRSSDKEKVDLKAGHLA